MSNLGNRLAFEHTEHGDGETRLDCIPVLHVRGTHYQVGFTIGRTFRSMISELLETWKYVSEVLVEQYLTTNGRILYENCLKHCQRKFPNYVNEIEGMADGAKIPFFKLFLLNIDSIMAANSTSSTANNLGATGCTSIFCNKEELILGHSEDADKEILNNVYIISAEILDPNGIQIEKFTSFSYAGHLVGYTMGFNEKGMVHSVNTIFPQVYKSGSPRSFIARALLNASTLDETLEILRDSGTGISDGFSLNIYFDKEPDQKVFNIEICPPSSETSCESQLDILSIERGSTSVHSNKFCRIKVAEREKSITCSTQRHETIEKYASPCCAHDVKNILSDQSNQEYPIFLCHGDTQLAHVRTVAVGIFNINEKTWSIFLECPAKSNPLVVIQMNF